MRTNLYDRPKAESEAHQALMHCIYELHLERSFSGARKLRDMCGRNAVGAPASGWRDVTGDFEDNHKWRYMLPDIDSLALFVKAAEFRSLTRAAAACHIGLASASRRIVLLEHRLRCMLLERTPRGVEVTPAGNSLLPHARQLLALINHIQTEMADYAVGHKGQLRVLVNTSALTQFTPEDLAQFTTSNPGIQLFVEESWSMEIIDALLKGEADVGIVVQGYSLEGLESHHYKNDQIAVVLPRGHPLLTNESLRFKDVLDYELVGLESSSSLMRLLIEQAAKLQKDVRFCAQVRGFDAICKMVQASMGIGLLPSNFVSQYCEKMAIELRPLDDEWATRKMFVCVKKDRPRNTSLSLLLEALKAPRTAAGNK